MAHLRRVLVRPQGRRTPLVLAGRPHPTLGDVALARPARTARGAVAVTLHAVPVDLAEANAFVGNFHRHNKPVVMHKFSVGVSDGAELWGVAIAGQPVARLMVDGHTLEATRCCVRDGAPKGCASFLYASLWRAARALGYRRLITYTLQTESGASMRGAGWRIVAELAPRSDARQWTNRPGREWQAVTGQAKFRWEVST